ncbi:MAG TPA: universal stress protein [Nocardioidaceae bacterium]|nr:universal stress protein [Nocardioidaceae bacterium]
MRAAISQLDAHTSPEWTATIPRIDRPSIGFPQSRLLFPYSGSPTADNALDAAAEWAHALRADAWAIYVRAWDTCRGGHYYVETPAEASAVAQVAVNRLRQQGVTTSGVVRDADRAHVARAIVAEAEALDVRLIVLGTRARSVLGTALLGSTSTAVARRASRPVILVHGTCSSAGRRQLRR